MAGEMRWIGGLVFWWTGRAQSTKIQSPSQPTCNSFPPKASAKLTARQVSWLASEIFAPSHFLKNSGICENQGLGTRDEE